MSSVTGAIKAGRAFVELYADTSKLTRGLRLAAKELKAWGNSIRSMGTKLMAVGAAIVAPLALAAKKAAEFGHELEETSEKIGLGVESLSALSYAADQSGISLEILTKSILLMYKQLYAAGTGSKKMNDALAQLGLTYQDLANLSPEAQFMLIAERLGSIKDPALKAALAMKIFGRGGAALLPLLKNGAGGIRALTDEAKRLGLVFSAEDVAATAEFYSAIKKLWYALQFGIKRVGLALVPLLEKVAATMTEVVATASKWIQQNGGIVTAVFWFGTALVGAGVALFAFGNALIWMSKVCSIIATGLAFLRAALLALFTPIGIIIASLSIATAAFLYFSGYGAELMSWLGGRFRQLAADAKAAFSGIAAALANGNIALAARIAWLGVQIQWLEAKSVLLKIWLEIKNKVLEYWYGLGYAMIAAWSGTTYGIKVAWTEVVSFLKQVWIGFKQWWGDTIDWIASKLLKVYFLWKKMTDSSFDAEAAQKEADAQFAADRKARAGDTVNQSDQVETERQAARDRAKEQYDLDMQAAGESYANDLMTMEKEAADRLKNAAEELAKTRKAFAESIVSAQSDEKKMPQKAMPKGVSQEWQANLAGQSNKIMAAGSFSGFSRFGFQGDADKERMVKGIETIAENTRQLVGLAQDDAEGEVV